ncbi:MAG: anti-sigma factor family protein [Actinomycetota bacterium]
MVKIRWSRQGRMPSCKEVGRLLQSYLDGELDDLRTQQVARHLEVCLRCGLEASTYREIKQSLRRRGEDLPPESLERLRDFGRRLAAGEENDDARGDDADDEPAGA